MATAVVKLALFGVVVAVYARPEDVAIALGVPAPDGGFQQLHEHVVRFLLTAFSYSWALSCSSAWYYSIMALILLQTICWASFLADQRLLADVLGGIVDAQTEKKAFQLGAVVAFALLLLIILFGARTTSKNVYRRKLLAFYTKHNPEKIADVGKILKKYDGKEALLFARLHRKYSVLSHTSVENAVDEFDGDGDDEADADAQEPMDEVEYIQELPEKEATDDSEGDSEGDEMIMPRVKSPLAAKPPSEPVSPSTKLQSAPGSGRLSSPRSSDTTGGSGSGPIAKPGSKMVRSAIEDARRAQEERVQQRIAQLTNKTQQ